MANAPAVDAVYHGVTAGLANPRPAGRTGERGSREDSRPSGAPGMVA